MSSRIPGATGKPLVHSSSKRIAYGIETTIQHRCNLNIYDSPSNIRMTGIICTIGTRPPNAPVALECQPGTGQSSDSNARTCRP